MSNVGWIWVVTCSAMFAMLQQTRADAAEIEKPPSFQASSLVPPLKTKGSNYSIDDVVENDGFEDEFVLRTPYGVFIVVGRDSLDERIRELGIISRIEQIDHSEEFTKQFGAKLMAPVATAEKLVRRPGETVAGVFTGVGDFFDKASTAARTKDPDQGKGLSALLGFDSAKRQIAFRLGADPYSRFQPLQDQLDRFSRTVAGARLTASALLVLIPGAGGTAVGALGTAGDLENLVRDNTPAQLSKRNRQQLARMGVSSDLASRFLANPSFTPTEKTAIVEALRRLKSVSNRAEYIRRAADIDDVGGAYFFYRRARLTAAYNDRVERISSFVTLGGVPFVRTDRGKIVAVFPVDHLAWTTSVDRIFTRVQADGKGTSPSDELWLSGTASPLAKATLAKSGWVVHERANERLKGPR